MAQQNVNVGDNYNRGSGDRLRDAFVKVNSMMGDLYGAQGGSSFTVSANRVLAGPSAAGTSAPSMRYLVNADLPDQSAAGFSAGVYTANPVQLTVNSKGLITVVNRDGPAAGGTGPSSVALSADPIFTVSGSPIVSGSTITLNFATQNANLVLAAGTSGAASAPRFRSLVAGDFAVVTANLVLAGPRDGGASAPSFRQLSAADLASVAALSGGTYTNPTVTVTTSGLISVISTGAGGGVTSVGFSADPIFSVSGAPITADSAIALDLANQNANAFLAGPRTGGASAPSFRTLTAPDLPNWQYNGQTSGYGLTSADRFAVVDYTGTADGSWSAIDAAAVGIGHLIKVHNSSASGQLVIDGHSTHLIDGFTAVTVLPKQSLTLMTSDASTWRIVGGGSYLIRQSIVIPGESFNSRAAQGAIDGLTEMASAIVIRTKDFDPGTAWFVQKDITLPDSFYADGPLKAVYHASIASGSGVGVMGIQAIAYGSNSSLNVSFGTLITQGMTFVSGNVLTNSGAASAPFVPAGTVAAGATLKIQVQREAGTASDTLATNLRLHDLVLEYDAIKFGSDG